MIFLEEIRSVTHGNAEIGTKLLISVAVSRFEDVLINASAVYQLSINHILLVFLRLGRYPVAPLEVQLYPVGPLLVGP